MKPLPWLRAIGLGLCAALQPAEAQSLTDQYRFFLANKCSQLGFARAPLNQILPGQAGPNLFEFCNGPPVGGDGPIPTGVDRNAGVGAGRSRDAVEESVRRRREREGSEDEKSVSQAVGLFGSVDVRTDDKEVTSFEGGRTSDRVTVSAGADRRVVQSLVTGIVIRGEKLEGSFDTGGGVESKGSGATLFLSWTPFRSLFLDLSAGLDDRSIEMERIAISPDFFARGRPSLNSKTDTREESADLSLGYDFSFGFITVGPRAGASYRLSTIDRYLETGDSHLALAFDEQRESSLRSSVGAQLIAAFPVSSFVVVPQLYLTWHHEFRDDQTSMTARFAEDLRASPVKFSFLNEAPDRDTYSARLSAVALSKNGFGAFLSIEQLFGHEYLEQTTYALGVRKEIGAR